VPWSFTGTNTDAGRGALDLDSSPGVNTYDGGLPRSERQTTPSEWPTSPERFNIQHSPSHEVVDQLPISPPSTPPLFTPLPQVARQSSSVIPDPGGDHDFQATPETVEQAELISLRPPTPAQRRPQSQPLPSSSSAFSSALVTPNLRHKTTSLPVDVFGSNASHARRVPPPSAKNTKEPRGEVLVPGSDSGGPDTQSSSIENSSSLSQRRAMVSAGPGRVNTSLRMSSSPERVNDAHDAQSSALDPGFSQEPDKGQLDELSRMALNGSYTDHVRGSGVQAHNGAGDKTGDRVEPGLPSPEPNEPSYEPLPPSSLPIYSQIPSWDRSISVEETAVMEGTPSHVTPQRLPTSIAKRTSLSPSLPRAKRSRLMSTELVNRSREVHRAAPRKVFDPELLGVGIEVNLTDFDGNPPPYPRKEGLSRLSLGTPDHSLFMTNSKLAEIWKSVCKYRGWCET
jgi:hypothetical protein